MYFYICVLLYVLLYFCIPVLSEEVPSPAMIPTNSSLQVSSVTTVENSHSVTCTQYDTSATTSSTTVTSIMSSSSSVNVAASLSVSNPTVGAVGQESYTVTTGKNN